MLGDLDQSAECAARKEDTDQVFEEQMGVESKMVFGLTPAVIAHHSTQPRLRHTASQLFGMLQSRPEGGVAHLETQSS